MTRQNWTMPFIHLNKKCFAVLDNDINGLGERMDAIETRREVNRVLPSFGDRGPELRQLIHPSFHLFSRPTSPL